MNNWINRKDFEKIFASSDANNKYIRVIQRVNNLPIDIIELALRLSELEFINFIKITDHLVAASSHLKGKSKDPLTIINHLNAIGVEILYHYNFKFIDFTVINSPVKGCGSKMVDAILNKLPDEWQVSVVMGWSNDFWDVMNDKYKNRIANVKL
jgi:hypothetical protein